MRSQSCCFVVLAVLARESEKTSGLTARLQALEGLARDSPRRKRTREDANLAGVHSSPSPNSPTIMQASRFCARQRVVLRQFSSHAPAPSPLPTPAPKASAFYPPASPSSPKPSIIRPLAFSVGVALAGLATAAYLTNSDAQRVSKEIVERTGLWRRNQRTVSDGEMATFRQRELLGTAQAVVAEFPRSARLPTVRPLPHTLSLYAELTLESPDRGREVHQPL